MGEGRERDLFFSCYAINNDIICALKSILINENLMKTFFYQYKSGELGNICAGHESSVFS
jgi:hypothetical protein